MVGGRLNYGKSAAPPRSLDKPIRAVQNVFCKTINKEVRNAKVFLLIMSFLNSPLG